MSAWIVLVSLFVVIATFIGAVRYASTGSIISGILFFLGTGFSLVGLTFVSILITAITGGVDDLDV